MRDSTWLMLLIALCPRQFPQYHQETHSDVPHVENPSRGGQLQIVLELKLLVSK